MIGYYDKNGDEITMEQWGVLFQDWRYRCIAQHCILGVMISTVWIGIDPGIEIDPDRLPLIFETMIFNEEQPCYKWATEDQARREHEKLVAEVKLLAEAVT